VAAYLGRGVRTVQRWEQELGLPVRRPRGKSRSAVIAFKPELDKWLHEAPAEQLLRERGDNLAALTPRLPKLKQYERQVKLHDSTESLISKTHLLLSRSNNLNEQLKSLREKLERTVKLTKVSVSRHAQHIGFTVVTTAVEEPRPTVSAKPTRKNHAIAS
jgi:DNA-binding transcriptional regulator YiaG